MGRKTYPIEICPFFIPISNLFFRGKPHKIGSLLALAVILDKLANDSYPGFIGAIRFQQDRITYPTFERAHSSSNNLITSHFPPLTVVLRIVVRSVRVFDIVDPFPGQIINAQFVVGIFAADTLRRRLSPDPRLSNLSGEVVRRHGDLLYLVVKGSDFLPINASGDAM